MLNIIAQCATTFNGLTVWFPASLDEYLRVLAEAPVQPHDLVPDLEPGVLDRADHPMIRTTSAERYQVTARLQDLERGPPGVDLEGHPAAVPLLAHEALSRPLVDARGPLGLGWGAARLAESLDRGQVVWWICNYRVDQVAPVRRRAHGLDAVAVYDLVPCRHSLPPRGCWTRCYAFPDSRQESRGRRRWEHSSPQCPGHGSTRPATKTRVAHGHPPVRLVSRSFWDPRTRLA